MASQELDPSRPPYGHEQHEEIPRVRSLTQPEFETYHYNRNLPVIIAGKGNEWRTADNWTLDYFRRRWGHINVKPTMNLPPDIAPGFVKWADYLAEMPLSGFLEMLDDAPYPCYLRESPTWNYPGLEEDFTFDILDERVSRSGPYSSIWVQSKHVNSSLHIDTRNNFLAQMMGRKRLTLYPPSESKLLYPFPDTVRYSRVVPYAPDLERYPDFARARGMRAVLQPGDVVFIPQYWWHHLCSLDVSVSISCFYGPSWPLSATLRSVATAGVAGFLATARDFVSLGLFKRKRSRRGMADVPTGQYIYEVLEAGIKRRLRRRG